MDKPSFSWSSTSLGAAAKKALAWIPGFWRWQDYEKGFSSSQLRLACMGEYSLLGSLDSSCIELYKSKPALWIVSRSSLEASEAVVGREWYPPTWPWLSVWLHSFGPGEASRHASKAVNCCLAVVPLSMCHCSLFRHLQEGAKLTKP